jgi:probable HAF family extracellular repeat protein
MPSPRLLAAITVLVALAVPTSTASAATLQPAVLPALGGGTAFATGVNSSGVIVGSSTTAAGDFHAVVWRNGRVQDLGTLGGGTSEAYAIDDQGRIVGESVAADGRYHAVMWREVTTSNRRRRWQITDLGNPGTGPWASAYDINASGGVALKYTIGEGFLAQFQGSRGVLWRDGRSTPINLTPGVIPNAVNDQDHVVGVQNFTYDGSTITGTAFMWQNGTGRDLGTLGGGRSTAYDINNRGQVVGESLTANGYGNVGFIWENGTMRRLPIDRADTPSYNAASINDAGNIAGTAAVNTLLTRALFWSSPTAQPQTLAVPAGHSDASARTVGPQGWVLGIATRNTSNFALSAVVWR